MSETEPKRRGRPPKMREDVAAEELELDQAVVPDETNEQPPPPDVSTHPKRVQLVRPHGFIDEYGQNRHWQQGEIVGDPAQVALLIERGAHLQNLD